jgi:hypothetical protein
MSIQKPNTANSPLLQPVQHRDYTKGMNFEPNPGPGPSAAEPKPADNSGNQNTPNPGPGPGPGAGGPTVSDNTGSFQDKTKSFEFDAINDNPSDLNEGENIGVTMPTGSARTFANTIGNLVQIYLPRATYGYVKIDIENVRMHVEKGNLTENWIPAFTEMNKSAEEALKIPDEVIKMWKSALQHYLEYKQVKFANPETEFWAATAVLLTDQGVRTYGLKKQLEQYMREALQQSNPSMFDQKNPAAPRNNEQDLKNAKKESDERRAA